MATGSKGVTGSRGSTERETAMVIAATTLTPAAFCVADDLEVIRPSPRAAGGHGRGVFYCRPGLELGLHFWGSARKTRSYGGGANSYKTSRRDVARVSAAVWAVWFNRFTRAVNNNLRAAAAANRARPLPPDYRRLVVGRRPALAGVPILADADVRLTRRARAAAAVGQNLPVDLPPPLFAGQLPRSTPSRLQEPR